MGFDVRIGIMFELRSPSILERVAATHLERLGVGEGDSIRESHQFLTSIVERRSINCGWKGEMCAWAQTGNYSNPHAIAELLAPFFFDAYRSEAIFTFDSVLIISQGEARQRASAITISAVVDYYGRPTGVEISAPVELPISW